MDINFKTISNTQDLCFKIGLELTPPNIATARQLAKKSKD